MNFSSSGSQAGCTVGDYLSTIHSSGLVGYHVGQTLEGVTGAIIGGILTDGMCVLPGAAAGVGIGGGLGYGIGGVIGLGSQYNACYH
ncbi:hypothetical protein [Bartonella taylorii]|uniref:Uncharacterized protein n=1 Tax=Bartonella taylorii TaxID=33046 RepID=A0A9Q8YXR5_BARTA|nr:hypothetical protein [Bartonella taylorii]USP03058.1 hypothetical protein LAJ60_00950 [Bartonella taylorii]